jgi:hypothetical protein
MCVVAKKWCSKGKFLVVTRLALHGTCWCEAQGLQRRSAWIGRYTCPALYGGLLNVLD